MHDENEDDDEDGSEEVSTHTFSFVEFHFVGKSLHIVVVNLFLMFHAGGG